MTQSKPTILIVDDEPEIRKFLRISLTGAGYKTDEADNGRDGARIAVARKPDAVLLDLGLPQMDGQDALVEVRKESAVPIIILSVRDDQKQIVQALENGADDYLTKPFNLDELLARVQAVLRRSIQTETGGETQVEVGPIKIDLLRHEVFVEGQKADLSPKEFNLLHILTLNKDKVMTHRQLLKEVWGKAYSDDSHYLRVYMGQIRKKLAKDGIEPDWLKTVQGIGYMFDTQAVG